MGKTGLAAVLLAALTACESIEGNVSLGIVGATLVGGQAPSHEIEQVYYVGSLDPQGQLDPQMYRIRVHGQASFISQVDFASGWVPAGLIDSLSTKVAFQQKGGTATATGDPGAEVAGIAGDRRLVQFGPEGFRTSPKDQRLVIVMGSDPSKFFAAIDESLGTVAKVRAEQQNGQLTRELFEALVRAQAEGQRLAEVRKDVQTDIPGQ